MGRARTPLGTHGKIFTARTKAGTWKAVTYYRGMDGRRRKIQRTARTKAGAEHTLREYASQITQTAGSILSPHSTIADTIPVWWDEWDSEKKRAYNTKKTYSAIVKSNILPYIGDVQLIECTTGVANNFIKNVAKNHGTGAAKGAHKVLKMVFDTAARHDVVTRNPMHAVKTPFTSKKEIRVLNLDEVAKMRSILTSTCLVAFELMLATGARIGEILALRWEDIDEKDGGYIVHIRGTLINHGTSTHRQEHRKSGKNISLYLPNFAVNALEKYAIETLIGEKRRIGNIFIGASNGFMSPESFRYSWRKQLENSEFSSVHPHTIRATVATLLANNVNVSAASAQLGNTEGVLRNHYWRKNDLAPDARAVLSVFGG